MRVMTAAGSTAGTKAGHCCLQHTSLSWTIKRQVVDTDFPVLAETSSDCWQQGLQCEVPGPLHVIAQHLLQQAIKLISHGQLNPHGHLFDKGPLRALCVT